MGEQMCHILAKVRRWTFEPVTGRTVEVFHPLLFVAVL
jgi:hypothetical protein